MDIGLLLKEVDRKSLMRIPFMGAILPVVPSGIVRHTAAADSRF